MTELRYLKRITHREIIAGGVSRNYKTILQSRTSRVTGRHSKGWNDWEDVPTITEHIEEPLEVDNDIDGTCESNINPWDKSN